MYICGLHIRDQIADKCFQNVINMLTESNLNLLDAKVRREMVPKLQLVKGGLVPSMTRHLPQKSVVTFIQAKESGEGI